MHVKMLLYFLILFVCESVQSYDFAECSQNSVSVISVNNSYTFFESPNFPEGLSNGQCGAQFKSENESIYFWVAMLNGAADNLYFADDNNNQNKKTVDKYNSNFDIVTFTTFSNSLSVKVNSSSQNTWSAFQAAIITYVDGADLNSCPLNAEMFEFGEIPDQIIPVSNSFGSGEYDYKKCNWFFAKNPSQQLKVVVQSIQIAEEVELILNADGKMIKNFTSQDALQVFYFDGTSFNLTYEYKFANTTEIKFFLLISAIPFPSENFTNVGCQMPQSNDTLLKTIYTNVDYDIGYPIYQKCENLIDIPRNYEGILSITEYLFEGCCDKLSLIYGSNTIQPITWDNETPQPNYYTLTRDVDGGELVFVSDGNTQGAGFTAELQLYECRCADPNFFVECNTTTTFYPMNNSYTYCSNMNCGYTITQNPNCANQYFEITVVNHIRNLNDYIVLMENGKIAKNITAVTGPISRYYSSKSQLSLQFHSGPSLQSVTIENKFWNVFVTPIIQPKFQRIATLSNTNSKYILWLPDMNSNDAYTVCTTTGTLELFVTFDTFVGESNFILYDSDDLTTFVGDLNFFQNSSDPSIPRRAKSTSGCFTIFLNGYSSYDSGHTLLFRIAENYAKHCETIDTVFQVSYNYDSDISVKSSKNGSCEMTVLTLTHYPNELPHIWITNITADSAVQYSFFSTINDKSLFAVNGSEAHQWQSIGIYTLALSISVPSSSQISLHLSYSDQIPEYINIVSSGIQKGIMTSPSYCGFFKTFSRNSLYESNTDFSFLIDFVIKDIFGNPIPILESNEINQTLIHDMSLLTWKFVLNYAETDPQNNGFLIEYTIHGDTPIPTESTEMTTVTEIPSTILSSSPTSMLTAVPSTKISSTLTSAKTTTSVIETTIATTSSSNVSGTVSSASSETSTSATITPISSSTIFTTVSASSVGTTTTPNVASKSKNIFALLIAFVFVNILF